MNNLLIAGTRIVVLALIAYSIAILTEQKKHRITNVVLVFLTSGILLDIAATTFMILGSSKSSFSLHGILGYSSLGAMLVDTFLLWRFRLNHSAEIMVPKPLHLYSRFAYIWWVLAFITGSLLVLLR